MNRPDDYDLYLEEGMQAEEARYYEEILKEESKIKSKEIKQKQIIEHYGFDTQLIQLIEESSELIQAICKWRRNIFKDSSIEYMDQMIEEMADVKNLIEQLELNDSYIKHWIERDIEYKVDRQIKRMEEE